MPRWTDEQQLAIDLEGKNVIVSAGAGSGKTAVLTARVLRKLKGGVHINELLVLTFTNAAAKEMKERIRKAIKKEPSLSEELNYIDAAYITTFDSFSLSLVKKYAYTLNLSNNIKISDQVMVDIKKKEIIDSVFDSFYENSNPKFLKLINDFCLKDDKELKGYILDIYKKLELNYDIDSILDNYIDKFFSDEKINKDIELFTDEIKTKINNIREVLTDMNDYFDGEYVFQIEDAFSKLFNATNYDEIISSFEIDIPRIPKNSPEEGKKLKELIPKIKKEVMELCIYSSSEEIKKEILGTKDNASVIIDILKDFHNRLTNYKLENEIYTFNDISRLAIKLVTENKNIRKELKYSFNEILVDEYQDTNDTQETFISKIANNNVYMVGDIKQSIYRFRNANPYIFKNKYDTYRDTDLGKKIDLMKNFRSRDEVLSNINEIFDLFMDDKLGGADYKNGHRMVFGNTAYIEEGKTNQNYNLELLTYEKKNKSKCSDLEKEIFIIGNDIKEKIKNKYQVFDKDEKVFSDITFKDFVILIDKSTAFDDYKKIFEYLNIPLSIYKDTSITNNYDISIIKNLLKLIINIKNKNYSEEFKYCYMSVGRSFIMNMGDEELFNIFSDNKYFDTDLYKKCFELSKVIDNTPVNIFFKLVLDTFNYEERLLIINNIEINLIREEYFFNLINTMGEEATIYDFVSYLDQVFNEKMDIRFSLGEDNSNAVKIMTIHKSKGLEYPICYFAGFTSEFNYQELRQRIIYDNDLGIILPYINDSFKPTIYKTMLKLRTRREEISEKIRLFYVATTRAKEQMIIVLPEMEEGDRIENIVPNYIREKYNSFYSIMKSIYGNLYDYRREVDTNNYTKDYIYNIKSNGALEKESDTLIVNNFTMESNLIDQKRYSKDKIHLIDKSEKDIMDFGNTVHEVLERIDFKKRDFSNIEVDDEIKNKINKFIDSEIIQSNLDSKFYKEFEFVTNEEDVSTHGIMDLVIENDDEIIIIDYKLKNIDDPLYINQLTGYINYMKSISDKKVSGYLYSIILEKFKEIKN